MYTPKYKYKELIRIQTDHGRLYDVGEGRPLPSVTTILSHATDHTWLDEWRGRVGDSEADRIVAESVKIGQGMHDLLEQHYTGMEVGKVLPLSRIYANVIRKKGLSRVSEVWGVECPLYLPGLYAGTSDLIGVHDGIPSVMDYKNSRRDKKEEEIDAYFMQLCAYSAAFRDVYGDNIRRGVIFMMSRSGKYLEYTIEGNTFDKYMNMWLGAVEYYYENCAV